MPETPPLRFGICVGIPDIEGKSHYELFKENIELIQYAEEMGLDEVWLTEHHASKHGLNSGVLTIIAALARETSRIRLGTSISVLPFWNPVRLAEEVAIVDLLSEGRFEFGVGSGYRKHEFTGLGIDPSERVSRYMEALHVLDNVFDGKPFTFDGQHYKIDSRGMRPLPYQQPHPPMWATGLSEPGIRWAGERGWGWMIAPGWIGELENMHPLRQMYYDAIKPTGVKPKIYLQMQALTARRSTEDVRAEGEKWVRWWMDAVNIGETVFGGMMYDKITPEIIQSWWDVGFHGSPDHVLKQVEHYAKWGVTDFGFQITFGPPLERLKETVQVLAQDVAPVARKWGEMAPVG